MGLEIDDVQIKTAGPEYFYRNKYNYLFTNDYNFAVISRKTNLRVKSKTFSLPVSIHNSAKRILDVLRSSSIPPEDLHTLLVRTKSSGNTVSRLYTTSKKIVSTEFDELNNFEIHYCIISCPKNDVKRTVILIRDYY